MTQSKPPRRFVKYGNRKLHEVGSTEAYISMEDLGKIVAKGHEIEIIDDVSGEDLTVATLARILYDQCRLDSTAIPEGALRQLIVDASKKEAA